MNRKTLPRFLNRRITTIEGLLKARGNGGNAKSVLYDKKTQVVNNRLIKNSPSSIISTGDKPKNYKYSSKSVGNKKLGDRARDIYEDDWSNLEIPSTKKRRYQ
jgi:hypothetical protein